MARIGIIGAGQLGQMLGYAGQHLGHECVFLDPGEDPPAAAAGPVLKYPFDSIDGLTALSDAVDVITYEFENVPVHAVEALGEATVYPPPVALEHAQDRLVEKQLFESLDIPVPGFRTVDSLGDLEDACDELGLPVLLKTRRLGYDGKGQFLLKERAAAARALDELGQKNLIAEEWVPFDREVSAIGARNVSGDVALYPLSQNEHVSGILSVSRAPADADVIGPLATDYLTRLLDRLGYVGVLALELFVVGDRLLANEFAPRVHNSGHWTIEGAMTSQFENHLRSILDMELGDTNTVGFSGMLNLIGEMPRDRKPFEADGVFLHDYGKAPRPGRKLGHATVVCDSAEKRDELLQHLAKYLNN